MRTEFQITRQELDEKLLEKLRDLIGEAEATISVKTPKAKRKKSIGEMSTQELVDTYPAYRKHLEETIREAKEHPEKLITLPDFQSEEELKDILHNLVHEKKKHQV